MLTTESTVIDASSSSSDLWRENLGKAQYYKVPYNIVLLLLSLFSLLCTWPFLQQKWHILVYKWTLYFVQHIDVYDSVCGENSGM